METILLAAALLLAAAGLDAALALAPLPVAMGLQNVAARRVSQAGIGITFVTGTLVRLAEALAAARAREGSGPLVPFVTWLAMVAGGVSGAAAYMALGTPALANPMACAALATLLASGAALSGSRP